MPITFKHYVSLTEEQLDELFGIFRNNQKVKAQATRDKQKNADDEQDDDDVNKKPQRQSTKATIPTRGPVERNQDDDV